MNFFSIFQFVEKNSKILDYQHKKVAFLHYLYTVGSLFFCCRAVLAYYFLRICHTNKYFAYDQALGQLHKLGITDGNLYLAFSPLVFFFFYIHWKIHPTSFNLPNLTRCWRFIYNVLVSSFDVFLERHFELYEKDSLKFALKKKNLKTYFLICFIQKIGFLKQSKNKRKVKKSTNITNKNSNEFNGCYRLVVTWLALEGMLIYLLFLSK